MQNALYLIINKRAIPPIRRDHLLPIGPGQMTAIPPEHLLLLDTRFIDKLLVEIDPALHSIGIVHLIIRFRHTIGKMWSKKTAANHKGFIALTKTFN